MTKALESHAMCAVCSPAEHNPYSLGVALACDERGQVSGHFTVCSRHQGYRGKLHGGIASSLLDAAMTHCLLYQGIEALTAQLDVRFHRPIVVGEQVVISAHCDTVRRGIYLLTAQLHVDGELRVSASGKFLQEKVRTS
ncbi:MULTISPECIES: PaaI family thioesterase [Vibrio]|uniref:Acyl-coenzyme A thioesterase THEM4 n=1 Tax=Vibrio fluvialis TaxID=676 RepID=A0AAX2LXB8_VIBFL|nr:PaaI family thioesterase [Vibrio fluvialis]MCG6508145.1 PaaI family thioesterase [Vibrio parahaemolyticus]AMF92044.1 PaaI family thioesterase [Vibrio fluvialis]EKO3367036.1 PaaI family thioesterase [Vibrio fluvialis]EKO3373415.1 PaaI family thioesterase [Vibrio fluvialis]EKO3379792.1 PaaI family thioesterase [Vibrio fluvialis]